jgi:hypothetical protein
MDTQERFEQLKRKYEPVLRFIEQNSIPIQKMNVQDDKLLIRVDVASLAMRQRLMDRITQIDPAASDVHPDIRVDGVTTVPNTGQTTVSAAETFAHQGEMPPH